jgi:3-deoxy-manno-octulosonate cytidylyltransferase (CMP-KDO synthetase)
VSQSTDDFIVVIPARFASSRFPGKALADLGGKAVVQRCYEQCLNAASAEQIVIATEDERIVDFCTTHGMNVTMTSDQCLTGTDRVAEVATQMPASWYINVQGDEPFLDPQGLKQMINAAQSANSDTHIINAYSPITSEDDFRSVTVPKVICSLDGRLMYASRAAIPTTKSLQFVRANRQIGMYAFTAHALNMFALQGAKTPHEELEDIEILRFVEMGMTVRMIQVDSVGIAIDTPEDLERAKQFLQNR